MRASLPMTAFILSLFATVVTSASVSTRYEIPDDNKVIISLTQANTTQTLPNSISVLVWNVHKGSDENAWKSDLQSISADANLVLLQEAMNDDFMPQALQSLLKFEFFMAQSFIYTNGKDSTGVATGSTAHPNAQFFRRSPDREPVLSTPKMSLLSIFSLPKGKPLLVVNIHAINFVTQSTFERQIDDLLPLIRDFKGAVIFAGDFNTWSSGRLEALLKRTKKMGLKQVDFFIDPREQVLDHIFVRDCEPEKAEILKDIHTSDHLPLKATLHCTE
ncbi:MAG: EEP domain-containing protein [Oligoflexia bacterium]|nr:MAG: EEP domain-containing protein [Oligoflexia bacterium]